MIVLMELRHYDVRAWLPYFIRSGIEPTKLIRASEANEVFFWMYMVEVSGNLNTIRVYKKNVYLHM